MNVSVNFVRLPGDGSELNFTLNFPGDTTAAVPETLPSFPVLQNKEIFSELSFSSNTR